MVVVRRRRRVEIRSGPEVDDLVGGDSQVEKRLLVCTVTVEPLDLDPERVAVEVEGVGDAVGRDAEVEVVESGGVHTRLSEEGAKQACGRVVE